MRVLLTSTAVLLALTAHLVAQTAPAAVAGRVTDSNGKPISGVAVSLGGPALKTPQTVDDRE